MNLLMYICFMKNKTSNSNFIKLYTDTVLHLPYLTNSEYTLLLRLVPFIKYNDNELHIGSNARLELCQLCGLKIDSINKAISGLVRMNILLKIEVARYQMNPLIMFNGDEIERVKLLKDVDKYKLSLTKNVDTKVMKVSAIPESDPSIKSVLW